MRSTYIPTAPSRLAEAIPMKESFHLRENEDSVLLFYPIYPYLCPNKQHYDEISCINRSRHERRKRHQDFPG